MKIGLVAKEFINNNIEFNMKQIINTALEYKNKDLAFLCFGEAFLQGFDAFNWDKENDYKVALTKELSVIRKLREVAKDNHVGLAFGYLENDNSKLYSSYLFIDNMGNEVYNYRRYTSGWKEIYADQKIYQEGKDVGVFSYKDKKIAIGLCGDFWDERYDYIERIAQIEKDFVIWPVYVNFTIEEWNKELEEYAKQSFLFGDRVLMINSLSKNPCSHGGSFDFMNGKVRERTSFDKEDILIVSI